MILTVIDTETSGVSLKEHELLEIGLISYVVTNDGERLITKKFEKKIKPRHIHTANHRALEINGYNKKDWEDAVFIEEVLPEVTEMIEKSSVLMGQNLIFDLRFFEKAYKANQVSVPKFPPYIDTKSMADKLRKIGILKKSGMDYLCEHFNIKFDGRAHTAIADCERTAKAFDALLEYEPDYDLWTFEFPYEPWRR